MVHEAVTLSIRFPLYPSLVLITATTHGIFEVGNSMSVSSPGSDIPQEAPLAPYLYERPYLKKGRNKSCAKSTSLRGGMPVAFANGKVIRRGACSPRAGCGWRSGGGTGVCCVDTTRLQPRLRASHAARKARGSGQMFC